MEEKTQKSGQKSEGRDSMPQELSRKNLRRLWEWQRYVKKETQRIVKSTDDESSAPVAKPPLPKGPEKKKEKDNGKAKAVEQTKQESKPREISTKDLEKLEHDADVEQDMDILMSESDEDIELDDTLKKWIEPKSKADTSTKSKKKKKTSKTEKTDGSAKAKQSKTETLELFSEELEKARKKRRSPRKTREHLIENLLDPVISLDEAAVILNVCKTTVRRYTNSGKLECLRTPGNQRRFRLSNVLEFLEEKEGKKASNIREEK